MEVLHRRETIRIVSPPEVRTEMRRIIARLTKLYED